MAAVITQVSTLGAIIPRKGHGSPGPTLGRAYGHNDLTAGRLDDPQPERAARVAGNDRVLGPRGRLGEARRGPTSKTKPPACAIAGVLQTDGVPHTGTTVVVQEDAFVGLRGSGHPHIQSPRAAPNGVVQELGTEVRVAPATLLALDETTGLHPVGRLGHWLGTGDPSRRGRVVGARPMVDGDGALGRRLASGLRHKHLLPEGDLVTVVVARAHAPGHGIGPRGEDGGRIVPVGVVIADLGGGVQARVTIQRVGRTGPKGGAPTFDEVRVRRLVAIVGAARGGEPDLRVGSTDDTSARPTQIGIRGTPTIVDPRGRGIRVPSVVPIRDGNDVRGGLGGIGVKDQSRPGPGGPTATVSPADAEGGADVVLTGGKEAWIETPTAAMPCLIVVEGRRGSTNGDISQSPVQSGRSGDVAQVRPARGRHIKETRDGSGARRKVQGCALSALRAHHDVIQPRTVKGPELCLGVGIRGSRVATGAKIDLG